MPSSSEQRTAKRKQRDEKIEALIKANRAKIEKLCAFYLTGQPDSMIQDAVDGVTDVIRRKYDLRRKALFSFIKIVARRKCNDIRKRHRISEGSYVEDGQAAEGKTSTDAILVKKRGGSQTKSLTQWAREAALSYGSESGMGKRLFNCGKEFPAERVEALLTDVVGSRQPNLRPHTDRFELFTELTLANSLAPGHAVEIILHDIVEPREGPFSMDWFRGMTPLVKLAWLLDLVGIDPVSMAKLTGKSEGAMYSYRSRARAIRKTR